MAPRETKSPRHLGLRTPCTTAEVPLNDREAPLDQLRPRPSVLCVPKPHVDEPPLQPLLCECELVRSEDVAPWFKDPAVRDLEGFVLGEDDRIDPGTVEDFKRSGLAHLLAVSGDCVMLLALLGASVLGAFQLRHDEKLTERGFLRLMLVALRKLPMSVTRPASGDQ